MNSISKYCSVKPAVEFVSKKVPTRGLAETALNQVEGLKIRGTNFVKERVVPFSKVISSIPNKVKPIIESKLENNGRMASIFIKKEADSEEAYKMIRDLDNYLLLSNSHAILFDNSKYNKNYFNHLVTRLNNSVNLRHSFFDFLLTRSNEEIRTCCTTIKRDVDPAILSSFYEVLKKECHEIQDYVAILAHNNKKAEIIEKIIEFLKPALFCTVLEKNEKIALLLMKEMENIFSDEESCKSLFTKVAKTAPILNMLIYIYFESIKNKPETNELISHFAHNLLDPLPPFFMKGCNLYGNLDLFIEEHKIRTISLLIEKETLKSPIILLKKSFLLKEEYMSLIKFEIDSILDESTLFQISAKPVFFNKMNQDILQKGVNLITSNENPNPLAKVYPEKIEDILTYNAACYLLDYFKIDVIIENPRDEKVRKIEFFFKKNIKPEEHLYFATVTSQKSVLLNKEDEFIELDMTKFYSIILKNNSFLKEIDKGWESAKYELLSFKKSDMKEVMQKMLLTEIAYIVSRSRQLTISNIPERKTPNNTILCDKGYMIVLQSRLTKLVESILSDKANINNLFRDFSIQKIEVYNSK